MFSKEKYKNFLFLIILSPDLPLTVPKAGLDKLCAC